MNKLKMNLKSKEGITLISLVVTIIILIILASISISMILGNNGLLNKAQTASDETKKSQATETMNLKITNIQISSYAETQELPNLQYLADKLCDDNDMEYVLTASKEHASLDKIDVTNFSSIFTKLKEYPYEFEINSSLQLASIDGIKVANTSSTSSIKFSSDLENWINTLKDYTITVDDINGNNLLSLLMNNRDSVDYMISNEKIINSVLANENSMKALGKSDYASYKVATNSNFMKKVNSSEFSDYFGKTIEKKSDNTNILYSRIEQNSRQAYYAFDMEKSTGWSPSGINDVQNDYIGYDFNSKKIVYKFTIDGKYYDGNTYYYQPTNIIFQASNDNVNWTSLQECNLEELSPNIFYIDNTSGYRYYRCFIDNSNTGAYISSIQFYYVDFLE